MSEPVAWMVDCDGKCDLEPTVETERPETMDRYECGNCGRGPEQMTVTPLYTDPEPDSEGEHEGYRRHAESKLIDAVSLHETVTITPPEAEALLGYVNRLRDLRDRLQE